ncbi:uncharacterized protein LOC135225441 [Macrobrachium nipponense]|uniref:uncharacterized protein LOC135225441 n=1 Tax=Macrobrachium nipponense TaxID=159736 RepID=UPI0030C87DCD
MRSNQGMRTLSSLSPGSTCPVRQHQFASNHLQVNPALRPPPVLYPSHLCGRFISPVRSSMATACHVSEPSKKEYNVKDQYARPALDPFKRRSPSLSSLGRTFLSEMATNSSHDVTKSREAAEKAEAMQTVCIYCKKEFPPGPEYICHLTLCVAVRRPRFALEFQSGDITDDAYRRPTTIIAQVVDCTAMRPFGVSRVLAGKYPFASPYTVRRRVGAFNWACRECRAAPGSIAVFRPKGNDPIVASMFAQFYKGRNIEDNVLSQNVVSQLSRVSRSEREKGLTSDDHFLEGLQSDTLENRVRWFQQCLGNLAKFSRMAWVRRIVFPYMVGDGLSLEIWEKHYVPAIRTFSKEVCRSKIHVVVLDIGQNMHSACYRVE